MEILILGTYGFGVLFNIKNLESDFDAVAIATAFKPSS
jgi:hypothetical protein